MCLFEHKHFCVKTSITNPILAYAQHKGCWHHNQLVNGTKIMQSIRATNIQMQQVRLLVGRNVVIDFMYNV